MGGEAENRAERFGVGLGRVIIMKAENLEMLPTILQIVVPFSLRTRRLPRNAVK